MKAYILLVFLFSIGFVSGLEGYESPRSGFSADSQVRVMDTAVYNTGYNSVDGTDWQAFSLSGTTRGNWIVGEATADIDLTGVRYVAIYSCSWSSGWNCGSTWQVRDRGEQAQPSEPGTIEGDYEALMQLYEATNGDNWWENQGWQDSTPETMDEMYGIIVYPFDHEFSGRVQEIDLFQNNLVGTVESVAWEQLSALESLKLKQPLTAEEFYASNPDGQVPTNPPEKLSGELPASLGELKHLKWLSLSGQFADIELSRSPPALNAQNYNPGFGTGKKYVNGNFFTGQLPPEWGGMQSLVILEIRNSDNLSGSVPIQWEGMTNIKGVFLNDNLLTGPLPTFKNANNLSHIHLHYNRIRNSNEYVGFSGPIPDSYAQFPLNYLYLAYNNLSGEMPVFDQADDLIVFSVGRNDLTRFPKEIFEGGRNPSLNYFLISGNPIDMSIEDVVIDPSAHNLKILSLGMSNIGGKIPTWASQIGLKQFNFHYSSFTGLGDGFYDANAPVYRAVRNMRLNHNKLEGEIPDVLFAGVSHTGLTTSMPASDVVKLDMDLGVVESGTVTSSSSTWIHDSSKRGVWENHWIDYLVTIDPEGRNIEFEVQDDGNYASGYLYARERADVSNTEGLEYFIRPSVYERPIRFKLAENRYVARKIVSVDYETNEVTLDKPLDVDVSGKEFMVHSSRSITLLMYYHQNQLTGPIPQSWAYVPTHRDAYIEVQHNNLSGEIPNLSNIGADNGGSLYRLFYHENDFVFSDIIPNFVANDVAASEHRYAPQKPFGESRTISLSGSVTINDFEDVVTHPDNQYQWLRNDNELPGETSKTLTTSKAGEYVLRVTNPNVADLTLYSEPIEVIN